MVLARLAPVAALAAALVSSKPSPAFELTLGAGVDDISRPDDAAAAGALELRSATLVEIGPVGLRLAAAGEADADGDLWGGAGLFVGLPIGPARLEASFMPGLYAEGSGNELGHAIEFRSQVGASFAIADGWRLGAAVEHKSNANLGGDNPGVDTVYATLTRVF